MKLKKNRLLHYASVAVVAVMISSCADQKETEISIKNNDGTAPGFTAIYAKESTSLKTIVGPIKGIKEYNTTIKDTLIDYKKLVIDQRRDDGITNWNSRNMSFLSDYSSNELNVIYFSIDNPQPGGAKMTTNHIQITTSLKTPAFYNQLCAERWDEPITNGELSRAWTLTHYPGNWTTFEPIPNESFADDMIKFSAFDNKVSYKPGIRRSAELNKIVSPSKKEVFATFIVGAELIPDKEYSNNPTLAQYIKKGDKAEYVNISYDNGKDKYSLKIYKLNYTPSNSLFVVYIVSTNDVSSVELLGSVSDNSYATY